MEKVSIVLPTYNGARYIREALDSTLSQTYANFELIVVDGGSEDRTLEILASYQDPRLCLVHQPANSGRLPGALNLGFQRATGSYLTWMQDDDIYEPGAIETLVRYLYDHPSVDMVYSNYWWIDEYGARYHFEHVAPPDQLRVRNCVGHYFMYRRSVQDSIGLYDPAYFMAEDYEYWLRIYQKHTMQPVDFPLYLYRMHAGSLTFKDYGRYRALKVCAKARYRWLRTGWRVYLREMSAAYIGEAFASYQNGDFPHCRRALLHGLARNPGWLSNRGIMSLLAQNFLGYKRGAPPKARQAQEVKPEDSSNAKG